MNVVERFLKYVSFDTKSDEDSCSCPSTEKQLLLGKYLAEELKSIGVDTPHMDEDGYVYGFIPATKGYDDRPTIGFIAHMDTSPAISGRDVKPKTVLYGGGDISLSNEVLMRESEYPVLKNYIGKELIVTDGNTLLGADDKAGIAEIFSAVEYIINHPEIPHGAISIGITPDEEIGRGADKFNVEKFSADWAYTIDGGTLGEIEYENFNGASAKVRVNGVNIHPGSAKNKMKNAALLLCEFINMLPKSEIPAHTEGYEGFYHLTDISGDETTAFAGIIIRDHDRELFEKRKAFLHKTVEYLNSVYGESTFILDLQDSYYNMKEKILPHMHIIESAKRAMEKCGVTPNVVPIRGGTDGARLSYMGLPTPNLSTGGENFHSIYEFIPVNAMEKMVDVIVAIATENGFEI